MNSLSQRPGYRTWLPLILLIVGNILLGLLVTKDYGTSSDEIPEHKYAAATVAAYATLLKYHRMPTDFGPSNLRYKGPAFYLTGALITRALVRLGSTWDQTTIWHMLYFLTFQIAIISLYLLARRWMSAWAAFGAALVFATQPLLWGHAFINPKDIPFMGFFLASVAAGFSAVDRVARTDPFVGHDGTSIDLSFKSKAAIMGLAQQSLEGFTLPYLLFAGALLGFTTSMRILGPLAGGLVVLYAIYKTPKFLAGVLVPYFTVTAIIAFFLWPYLWADPLGRFIESLRVMSDFPWFGTVLFEGKLLAAADLPARFLPKMMLLQFTEPLILLFAGGVVIAVLKMLRKETPEPLGLLIFWLVIPLGLIILVGSTVYDNFRQEFFLIPPIFICAGLTLDWIFGRLRTILLNILILALMVAPGIYAIVNLHPYEYVYYNQLVGGVQGASRNYELDYWQTAYREAAQILDRIAPADAGVVVVASAKNLIPYSRPDIKIYSWEDVYRMPLNKRPSYEFVVVTSRKNLDIDTCRDARVIDSVKRDGAVLAVVKRLSPGETDCP